MVIRATRAKLAEPSRSRLARRTLGSTPLEVCRNGRVHSGSAACRPAMETSRDDNSAEAGGSARLPLSSFLTLRSSSTSERQAPQPTRWASSLSLSSSPRALSTYADLSSARLAHGRGLTRPSPAPDSDRFHRSPRGSAPAHRTAGDELERYGAGPDLDGCGCGPYRS